jgi:hypothetical protein
MMGSVFATGPDTGSIVLWALLGVAVASLLVKLMVVLSRAGRLEKLEHDAPRTAILLPGARRVPRACATTDLAANDGLPTNHPGATVFLRQPGPS